MLKVADKFEALPMTFMNFHAGSKLEEVRFSIKDNIDISI
jgi:hypothetical protein